MKRRLMDEGTTVYATTDKWEAGSNDPLCVVSRSEQRADRYGYLRSQRETFDTVLDTMGRFSLVSYNESRQFSGLARWERESGWIR